MTWFLYSQGLLRMREIFWKWKRNCLMNHLKAVIDLGTNTARLLVGHIDPSGHIQPLLVKRWITRLGGGFSRETGLSSEARIRTINALVDFVHEIEKHDPSSIRAVATSAVRDAINGKSFSEDVFSETGIKIEILSSRDEGLITLHGVMAGLDLLSGDLMVFDVGGGSTEYTVAVDKEMIFTHSLPLGVVRLTEGKHNRAQMDDKISRELESLRIRLQEKNILDLVECSVLVGTAGTATTLAAISMKLEHYDYRLVNGYSLSRGEIEEIFNFLAPMSPEERIQVPGLEKGREDLIIAGII